MNIHDALIRTTAGLLRALLRGGDAIGRTGGGEFMLVLAGRSRQEAESLLLTAREALMRDPGHPEPFSFSFGVAGSDEIPRTEDALYIQNLVATADHRMHRLKREFFCDNGVFHT